MLLTKSCEYILRFASILFISYGLRARFDNENP